MPPPRREFEHLFFEGTFNLLLVVEELYEAFPGWVSNGMTEVGVSLEDGRLLIVAPKGALDEAAIRAVLNAHNPLGKSKNQKKEERMASNVPKVRAALICTLNVTPEELKDFLEGWVRY